MRLYWKSEDCDWSTIAYLMRFQIRRTRLHMAEHAIVVGWERSCREMLIAETLLTRILEEPYADIAGVRYPKGGKHWALHAESLVKQDEAMLAKMLRRRLRTWWD
jgi:hypothetical protein